MSPTSHLPILKRAGAVLIAVGLIDIAVMVYCIVNGVSYSSSFNIFAVIAGVFLVRGSLRTASIVRWFAVFMLASFLALLIGFPFTQPLDLTLTELRLNPFVSLGSLGVVTTVLAMLFWLYRQLGLAPIQAAHVAAGRKIRDMRIPAVVGIGIVVILVVLTAVMGGGENASKAQLLAEQQLGAAYRYHVSSLNMYSYGHGTFVTAVVTAWNEREVRNVSVKWEER